MTSPNQSFRMSSEEKDFLNQNSFLLRKNVFTTQECEAIADDCEALFEELRDKHANNSKMPFGNYLFEQREELKTILKWEPDQPDLIQGIEPFAHLSQPLKNWSQDPRIVDPCKDLIGEEELSLFTEKINYKRAHKGGDYILHQDYPYWANLNKAAERIGTALLLLDDATVENGCLEVAPGTHHEGVQPCWNEEGGRSREIDTTKFDMTRLIPVEVPRGSIIFFGSLLVHRSGPNRSDNDRRALIFSYQAAHLPHAMEVKDHWSTEEQQAHTHGKTV